MSKDTPITDAAIHQVVLHRHDGDHHFGAVRADVCRQIERELAAAKAQLEEEKIYSSLRYDEMNELRAEVNRLRKDAGNYHPHGKQADVCVWVQDSDGPWNTSCGQTFEFTDDGPSENHALFCHHCGGALLAEPHEIDAAIGKEG